jgi:collagenase-like PrtC family protease
MLFNVPVIPDERFVELLNRNLSSFHACHFSLYRADIADCRHRLQFIETDRWMDFLASVGIARKFLLVNSRAHEQGAYLDAAHLRTVTKILRSMLKAKVIDAVVFADAYYLRAISDAAGDEASELEAIPSVNFMADSYDRIAGLLEFIASTRFKLPETLILDRSLNRRPDALKEVSTRCRKAFPNVALELLANEGCLYHCPYKLTHDCHISMLNTGQTLDTHRINRELGCMRTLREEPSRLFKSPFIRPEDLDFYEPYVDVLKLCGRTPGVSFLMRVVEAYLHRKYSGNLLDLMDAMDGTAQWLHVSNHLLPADLLKRLLSCSRDCSACSYCRQLIESYAKQKPLSL